MQTIYIYLEDILQKYRGYIFMRDGFYLDGGGISCTQTPVSHQSAEHFNLSVFKVIKTYLN